MHQQQKFDCYMRVLGCIGKKNKTKRMYVKKKKSFRCISFQFNFSSFITYCKPLFMVLRSPFQNWTQLISFPGLLSATIKWAWNLWWLPLANQASPTVESIREETAARPVLCGMKPLPLPARLLAAELQLRPSRSVRSAACHADGPESICTCCKKYMRFSQALGIGRGTFSTVNCSECFGWKHKTGERRHGGI